ncbi:MAG: PAS domain S-box protein [Bacteroidales bacterium]|nr:PAS domain S-box protein [Bacteroidales bacterium]
MANKTLKRLLTRNLSLFLISLNLVFGLIFGLIARNYQINEAIQFLQQNSDNSIIEINRELSNNHNKNEVLAEIVLSQINNPRAVYDFNSLFKNVLSSNPNISSIHVILTKNSLLIGQDLYHFRDSVGRFNASWLKNSSNLVYVDSINYFMNNFYFETLKNNPELTVFNATTDNQTDKVFAVKTIMLPLFDGTRFVGVLGYSVNSEFFYNTLFKNQMVNNTFICDEDGVVLYDRNKYVNIGKSFGSIVKNNFSETEIDILHNNDFVLKKGRKVLIFKSFESIYGVKWKIGTIIPAKEIYRKANVFLVIVIGFFLLFAIVVIIFVRILSKNGLKLLEAFSNNISVLKKGRIQTEIPQVSQYKELNYLNLQLESLRMRLLKLSELHESIKAQKLDVSIKTYGSSDKLGNSINEAIQAINERSVHRTKALEIEKKNDWITEGLNIIHDAARVTDDSLEELADKINEKVSVYSDAFLSSVFIYFEEENEEPILKSVSTFGLDKKRAFKKEIKLGEGVVGSVALERKTQYFDKIPSDYHIIVGGLSYMKPRSILVQKLEYEEDFYGILEIAFLRKLEKHELEFFDAASAEIALSVKNLISNIKTKNLLEKMKVQTAEIEKTKEMLQVKVKEISKKEREAKDNQATMQSMLNAVNNTLMTIEYTTKGILLTANNNYLNSMHYSLDELQGVNVLDLVKSERKELEDVINKVTKGEYYEKIMKRFTKYGEVKWLYSTYTPYYDAKGKITKVLYFAFDVTETKQYAEKLEKEISMLKKQVKILREKI